MADHGHPPSSSHHTGHGHNSSQHPTLEYDSFQSRPTIEDSYQQQQPQSSHYHQHPPPPPPHIESARAYLHESTSQPQRYPVSYQQQHSQHPPVPTTYPSHASTSTSSSSSKSFASYLPPRLDFGGANHQHHSYDSSSSQGPSSHPPPALPYHQVPETTAGQAPKPYKGKTTPFPLPVGKRSLGGLAGLEEQYGGAIPKGLYGLSPQPAALGKTRCYWALLSTEPKSDQCDPTFLYCDPILQNHLATEAEYLVGESFLEFVHPAEKEQARKDLESVIKNGGLFGSVVRCRYYRVPSIRTHLGCKNAPKAPGEHFFAADERYLPIDMVMNMVGDRMALCFFHAVINKSQQDNDESNKSDWTNWCGTPRELFNLQQCNKVWSSVISNQPTPRDDLASPPQVFQILSMPAGNGEPEIIFSWPPARFYANEIQEQQQQSGQLFSAGARLANHDDGSYFADEFAKLAQSVRTSPSGRTESGETARNGEPGTIQDGRNTSCTRRFRSKHTLTTHGMLRSIETVLIPYGTVMLACYNTTYVQTMSRNHASSFGSDFGTPSSQGRDMAIPQQVNYQSPSASSTNKRVKAEAHLVHPDSPAWPSANSAASSSSAPVSAVQEYSGSPASDHHAWPNSATTGRFRHGSVSTATSQNRMDSISPETNHAPHLPAGKRKSTAEMSTSNGAAASQSHEMPSPLSIGRNRNDSLGASSFEGGGSLGSNSAGPSAGGGGGEKRCTSCGTANSPEWRKGPTGQKTLCNACGLRFSRSVTRQQKNEEKAKGAATTTGSTSTSHSNNGPRSLANKATPAGLVSSGGYKPPIAPYYPGSQMPARRDPGSDQPPPSGGYGGYTAMQIHSMGWGSPPRGGDGSGNHQQHKQ